MTDFGQDVRYGVRMILKRPLTSGLAIAAFALGIGLTTTMFSIIQGAFLRGLPFEDGHRIVSVSRKVAAQEARNSIPPHDFEDLRTSRAGLEDLAGFTRQGVIVTEGLAPERYRSASITPNTLRVLRAAPALGRDFNDADAQPGATPVMILGHPVWESQFQSDPNVIGRVVRANGVPTTIVGVMPPKFGFPNREDLWTPLQIVLPTKRGEGRFVNAFGRLKTGASSAVATGEMAAVARRLESEYPENKNVTFEVEPYTQSSIGREVVTTMSAMLGAVFGVMLIACANVTSLQLARAAERSKEVAVRSALGASRSRIVRQMLIEGALLSAVGAVVGLGLCLIAIDLFVRGITGTGEPFWISVRIDPTVLLFVFALVAIAAIASTLVPALRATRVDLNTVLKDEGRANTGIHMGRFSRGLVVGEVLLSCCLLVVSGMLVRSVVKLNSTTYTFATQDVFVGFFNGDDKRYAKPEDMLRLTDRLRERWAAVPGVRRVSIASTSPGTEGQAPLTIEGVTYATAKDHPQVRRLTASAEYFEVLRVTARSGRLFGPGDTLGAPPVVVVDEGFARRYFPDGQVLGKRIKTSNTATEWRTIVGVVPEMRITQRDADSPEGVIEPLSQVPTRNAAVVAWVSGPPLAVSPAIRAAAKDIDDELAISGSTSLADSLYRSNWPVRVFGGLFMSFGFAALILASAGLYGVMAFSVRRRTQEIGVRMALGAGRGQVVRMILTQGMWRVGLGIALGLWPAYKLAQAMEALMYRTEAGDPLVFGVATGTLLLSGFVASLVPALRAAAVDPLTALRNE